MAVPKKASSNSTAKKSSQEQSAQKKTAQKPSTAKNSKVKVLERRVIVDKNKHVIDANTGEILGEILPDGRVHDANWNVNVGNLAQKQNQGVSEKILNTPLVNVTLMKHKDSQKGHTHLIIQENFESIYKVSVGLSTRHGKGQNSQGNNIKLEFNPLGNGKGESRMRREGTVDENKMYLEATRSVGLITEKDKKKAEVIGEAAKKKHESKKKK